MAKYEKRKEIAFCYIEHFFLIVDQNNFGNKMPLNFSRIHQELPFPPGKDQKISNKNVSLGSQRFLPKMNGHNPAENHRSRLGFTSW